MKKYFSLINPLLLLTLNLSCVNQKSTEKEVSKSELVSTSKTDTLQFTSGIRAIFQDSKGNYWFGSHEEGISKYDGKTFDYFTINNGLLDNQIRSIEEDKNGKIWFGTAKGVSVYDKGKVTHYATNINKPKYDWNETHGDLWFNAGERDGINRFDGKDMHYLIFPKPNNHDTDNVYGVTDISKAKDGKVWIATYGALFNYDGKKVNSFDHENLKLKENELLHIRSVLADSKGRIWIGNNGIGVLLKEGETIINFSEKHHLIHPTSTRRGDKSQPGTMEHVFAIEEDSKGNIWFGDRDTGAWQYDGKTLTNYIIDNNLKSKMVWTIYKDHNNRLLFGMAEGGVYSFNGESFEKQF
ncbi:diguanylate cyclase [Flavobacterium sp. IMCC34852]|uniref:Diguanylate cyclase n=1 Tax=Flavobacterium rivulicola TaxID=2732161 RepID=A0A7Y3VZ45_9FLAO|nr:two-component regulator propeller domain-containing protein [Flavobacterium sp. IMCC34852]NNT72363.1 diguanylate cyclase [Flavobacterium sp. IMCC34852]